MVKAKGTPGVGKVLIKPEPEETKTRSGIVLPDSAKEKPQEGTVIAIGSERISDFGQKIPFQSKVGDKIIYNKYAGSDIKVDGEELVILDDKDVIYFKG